jgi:PAS domain S-box-containing protein
VSPRSLAWPARRIAALVASGRNVAARLPKGAYFCLVSKPPNVPAAQLLRQIILVAQQRPDALEQAILAAPCALVTFGLTHTIEVANLAAETLFGAAPGGLLGQHTDLLLPPRFRQPSPQTGPIAVGPDFLRVEMPGLAAGGAELTMEFLLADLGTTGPPRYVMAIRDRREVTRALEALQASEFRFRRLVESVKDYAIIVLDTSGHVQSWNAGAERIKGYAESEILGKPFDLFYPPEARARGVPQELLRAAREQGSVEQEEWRVRKDGTLFWADVVITAVHDDAGQLVGYAKVTRDLTDRRHAEEERLRLAQAQEAVRLREEFLSIASHELKTPLTALQLQLQLLQRRLPTHDDLLVRATRSASRLAQLIEALLDVSRLSRGGLQLKREQVAMDALAEDVVERLREPATRTGTSVRIRGESSTTGNWDRLRLDQVLTNLISNAITHGGRTPVEVVLSHEAGKCIVEVCDRGPGLAPEDLERIFERFERAAPMRHFGGLGLGLYISRQIVEAHGGVVSARNREGGGACFRVELPTDSPPDGPPVSQ